MLHGESSKYTCTWSGGANAAGHRFWELVSTPRRRAATFDRNRQQAVRSYLRVPPCRRPAPIVHDQTVNLERARVRRPAIGIMT